MSSHDQDNHDPKPTEARPPSICTKFANRIVANLQGILATGVVVVGAMTVAIVILGMQTWNRSAESADRDLAESSAPFNRELATIVLSGSAEYRWADDKKQQAVIPIADAKQLFLAQQGKVGWATTQPAPIAPPAGVAAGPVVPGLNKARVKAGLAVFQRTGCVACHTTDGRAGVGPSLYNAFGSHADLTNGVNVLVDADYLRESIRQPAAKVHKGYPPVMPDFGTQIKDREVEALIEFIKSISPDPASRKETGPLAAPSAP